MKSSNGSDVITKSYHALLRLLFRQRGRPQSALLLALSVFDLFFLSLFCIDGSYHTLTAEAVAFQREFFFPVTVLLVSVGRLRLRCAYSSNRILVGVR